MKICPICKQDEANKKNVHLISWFLIKKAVTQKGSGLREKVLSFSISPGRMTKVYTGQGILPEQLEELENFEKEESEPYSRDNLLCPKCEDKLSRIEAIFAAEFSEKKVNTAFDKGEALFVVNKYDTSLFELVVQSIFYRCSIGRFDGFKLHPAIEKRMQENLQHAFLTPDFKKLKPGQKIQLPHKVPLFVSILANRKDEDTTRRLIIINQSRFPYALIAGRWVFQLFEEEKHRKSNVQWMFGATDKINKILGDYRIPEEAATILLLNEKDSEAISGNIVEYMADKEIVDVQRKIRQGFVKIFSKKPNQEIIHFILQQYIGHLNEDTPKPEAMRSAFLDFIQALQNRS